MSETTSDQKADELLYCVLADPPEDPVRVWDKEGWRSFVESGELSAWASTADVVPIVSEGYVADAAFMTAGPSPLVPRKQWVSVREYTEQQAAKGFAVSPRDEVCLLIFKDGGGILAPEGLLPSQPTEGKHPAEAVWDLACHTTGREDYSSFHRFAVSFHNQGTEWIRTWFYATAPDEGEANPLPSASWADLATVSRRSPPRHVRVLRQTEFARKALG